MSTQCGTVTITEESNDRSESGDSDAPRLPGIGPLTADNPRALAAGGALGALVVSQL